MFTLKYALRNLRRNWLRSGVTLLGVSILLFLVSFLMSVVGGFAQAGRPDPEATRLVARHEVSLTINLPEAYWERIRNLPHVVSVCPENWFGGTYIDQQHWFARFFVDPATFVPMRSKAEMDLPADQAAAWIADRQGCIVSDTLAKKWAWKLGQKITLKGDIYPVDVELNIDGIYHGKDDSLYFQRMYVEEALNRPGKVGTFLIQVDAPSNLPGVAKSVDELFANSDAPTKTETEAAFMAGFVNMAGNVEGLLRKLVAIIVVTMLLTAGNTMAMAVRERTGEVAILKAVGFLPARIVGLILTESVVLSGLAGLIGVGGFALLTWLLFVRAAARVPMLWFQPTLSPLVTVLLLLASVGIGVVAGLIPAALAARRSVIDGLRRN